MMEREKVSGLSAYQIAGLGVLAVVLAGIVAILGTLFAIRLRRRAAASGPADHGSREAGLVKEEVPREPGLDTRMSADVPRHFTEDIIVPGFTETGADIEKEDGTEGRSPQGV